MKYKAKRSKQRNPFYNHPLMKKGGVHQKPDKTVRHKAKQKLKTGEWDEQSVLEVFCSAHLLRVNPKMLLTYF